VWQEWTVSIFRYGTQVCGSVGAGAAREWLVADGLGGYAMGTASGLRTRRYHGLLVVAGAPRGSVRRLALASLDPVLTLPSGARIRLGTHEWASGTVDPPGYTLLECFEVRDGLPRWWWRAGDVVVERTLAMRHGHPSVAVVHTVLAGGPVGLTLEPLCTWRDAHGERSAAGGDLRVEKTADGVVVEGAYRVAGPGFEADGAWYHGVHHREEAARGLNPVEDLFRPGRFSATVDTGGSLEVSAWSGPLDTSPPPASEVVAATRRRAAALAPADADPVTRTLRLAADAFVVAGPDVVAGYPWFGAWSRDTMISYEGLFLATGRADEGRELLRAYAATLSEGMLANTADTGRVEHNTADATLWYLHAVGRHVAATGDVDLAAELVGALDGVVLAHTAGTRYGIRVDPADDLLTQGADGYALTWMDAIVDGRPVTPRRGKTVELNALWVNGLHAVAELRERLGRDATELRDAAGRATASFRRRFPAPSGWLYDVVDGPGGAPSAVSDGGAPSAVSDGGAPSAVSDGGAPSLRPNQLLAFGLPNAPMRGTDPAPVRHVARALLTPLGLRTLAPDDPAYRGAHRGDPAGRDGAYHQGTVWPWLIGPYTDAAAAVGLPADDALDGLVAHLGEWGIGSVSETADGDPPHAATGCPFQAWSVAELLRAWVTGSRGKRRIL
jgi:predicted glycogen debranching enzyme